jgi:hypothetical protein
MANALLMTCLKYVVQLMFRARTQDAPLPGRHCTGTALQPRMPTLTLDGAAKWHPHPRLRRGTSQRTDVRASRVSGSCNRVRGAWNESQLDGQRMRRGLRGPPHPGALPELRVRPMYSSPNPTSTIRFRDRGRLLQAVNWGECSGKTALKSEAAALTPAQAAIC